jgi:hypothetical protein
VSAYDPVFDAAVMAGPIVDNAGDGSVDRPGECTCRSLPAGHDDAECADATWFGVRS